MDPIKEALTQKYVKPTNRMLYMRQKEILETFLAHGAISRAQFEKSLGDLTKKMAI